MWLTCSDQFHIAPLNFSCGLKEMKTVLEKYAVSLMPLEIQYASVQRVITQGAAGWTLFIV